MGGTDAGHPNIPSDRRGRTTRVSRCSLTPGMLAFALHLVAGAAGADPESSGKVTEPRINPDSYTSSRVCGQCHVDIYESWKGSLHALSLTDPIFDAAFMQAVKEGGENAKRLCLRCHAPMTMGNGDYSLEKGVTREGVSCDFCHTVTGVEIGQSEKPYSIDVGPVKRSVLRKAASPVHEVAFSELHGQAEFCGGCHNYTTPQGVAIMSTYDEWKQGPYSLEGIPCQRCHMVVSAGEVVREDIKPSSGQLHLHSLIHDTDQFKRALAVRIERVERTDRGLEVEVEVENVGSGHKVPTGLPTREVILTVEVTAGKRTLSQERHFRKVVADRDFRLLKDDHAVMLHGAKVVHDNRIAPREKRREQFTFDVPRDGSAKLDAVLTYIYRPVVLQPQQMSIELGRAERVVD